MKRWLMLAAVVMLCAWAPFFYAELTSSPKEQKSRALPEDRVSDDLPAAHEDPKPPEAENAAEPEPEAPAAIPEKTPEQPGKEALAAKLAAESAVQAAANAAKNEAKTGQTPVDEAEATEPEAEGSTETPVPAPTASGPAPALKTAFETEARDPLWAADTEKQLRGLFRGGDLPAELLETASCRSAVCRVELRWTRERAPAYVSLYESVRKDFASEIGVEPIGTPDDKGQQQVNLYLARKGYTVADLTK